MHKCMEAGFTSGGAALSCCALLFVPVIYLNVSSQRNNNARPVNHVLRPRTVGAGTDLPRAEIDCHPNGGS